MDLKDEVQFYSVKEIKWLKANPGKTHEDYENEQKAKVANNPPLESPRNEVTNGNEAMASTPVDSGTSKKRTEKHQNRTAWVSMPQEDYIRLLKVANKEGVKNCKRITMSEIIRRAISEYLAKEQ